MSQKSDYLHLPNKKKKRPALGTKKIFSQNNSISNYYNSFEEEEVIEENIEIEEMSIRGVSV